MNVLQRECRKPLMKKKSELIRKDTTIGILGSNIPLRKQLTTNTFRKINRGVAPRYEFSTEYSSSSKRSFMGPPSGPPPNVKRRRITNNSISTKPESSSSGQPRILANDSADHTSDICTPRNRPTTLRYISSSSRGGHSGTRSARSTSISVAEASVILAISEGRGMARGEIGMAAVDLRQPHLVLCQFSDTLLYTHTLTKINYFNPIEIIVPHTFCEGVQPNQLYKLIKDQYPLINVTAVQRRHFNDAAGRQNIQTLCAPQYSAVYLQVLHKFYALTAAAAVLKYVEYIQCIVFARESLKIEYHSSENTMIIVVIKNNVLDVVTATQLELVHPLVPSAGPTCCLLGVLGPTYTIGGIRALRAAILQPSCNKNVIEARLDAVQELIKNDTGLMVDLQDVLKKLSDIDKILFLCIETPNQNMDKYGEQQLNQTILLKTTMEMVPMLIEALNKVESGKLKTIKMDLENPHYNEISNRIREIIQEDAHLEKGAMGSLQRCFAVKPEINGLLDVARRTYSELIDDIQKIVQQLSEMHDLPIRLNQNVMKGFHIVLPVAPKNRRHFNMEDLPPIFIQVAFNGASATMTTEELVVLDHQAKESLNEIQKMSNIVISSLLKELRPFMSSLYKLCENVAELDILLALAHASTIVSYIRPEFDSYLEIRNSVHPLLDYNTQVMPVPNDIFASPEYNFTIITGPNMGGKSIYIKQIAIMQIMAQLGCFLPATNAVLRLCDRIFSRIGFNDNVEFNASTYVIEMKETQHILKGLTSSSLVIIDELCRGTSVEEGTSIAWAICEELLRSDAFTFFTTHFLYLTRLQDLYFNVVNCHTAVTEESNSQASHKKLIYQHKIEPGVTKIEHYGLALAAKTNLPQDTVNLAKELTELIAKNKQPQILKSSMPDIEQTLYDLNGKIQQESRKNFDFERTSKRIIQEFKNANLTLIENMKIKRNITLDNRLNMSSDVMSDTIGPNSSKSISKQDLIHSNNNLNKAMNNDTPNSTTGYSYSIEENIITNNYIYSVKHSTELLNTIEINNHSNDLEQPLPQKQMSDNECDINGDLDNENELNLKAVADVNNNDSNVARDNRSQSNDDNESDAFNDYRTESESGSDSDIATALTQVLEETSASTYSRSDVSVNEELMRETIEEINEDLKRNNITILNDTILTPPPEFRDYNNGYD